MSLAAMGTSEHRNDSAAGLTLVRSPGPGPMSRCLALLLTVFVRPVITALGRYPHWRWPFAWLNHGGIVLPRPRRTPRRGVPLPNSAAKLLTPRSAGSTSAAILYLYGGSSEPRCTRGSSESSFLDPAASILQIGATASNFGGEECHDGR